MTEPAPELFNDPRRLFQDGAAAKQLSRERLGAALTGHQPDVGDAEALAEQVAAAVRPVVEAVVDGLVNTVISVEGQQEASRPAGGFDGGARESVPLPAPGHDEWLLSVIRQRLADAGGRF
jgi:hypothetical protein